MNIEVAQITTDPGCIAKNTAKIINSIELAKQHHANLIVFPELAIPGYMSMDLFTYRDFIIANRQALDEIITHTLGITAIVGFVDSDPKTIGPDGTPLRYNSAAIIQNGQLIGVEDKTLLPDYDVFYENRYFRPGRQRRVYPCAGRQIGVEICEDLWDSHYPIKVTDDLVNLGAQLVINLSASPFYVNKSQVREKLIAATVKRLKVPFVYCNLVGSQDGYDGQLVFDGQSLVFSSQGQLLKRAPAFIENQFSLDPFESAKYISKNISSTKQLHDALVLGIREYFRRTGFAQAFIGLSGGIDSALVAALSAEALGCQNITGISLPSEISSNSSLNDAKKLAQNLGINFQVIPIESARQVLVGELSKVLQKAPADLTNQNIQARIRGLILMAEANEHQALVISTGNKTETALGYCTLYGDMAGGLAAISDVDKLRVYKLARYINRQAKKFLIPQNSITKAPTAELSLNQTDENSLGADYHTIVPIVNELIENWATVSKLSKVYSTALVEKYWDLIIRNEHKRRQAAPGIKVTPKSFGIGRRFPISYEFKK